MSTEKQDIELEILRNLQDGIIDMIDGERLSEEIIPDDFQWLQIVLAELAALEALP